MDRCVVEKYFEEIYISKINFKNNSDPVYA